MRNRKIGEMEVSAMGLGCASIAGAWTFMDGPGGYGEVDDDESL